MQEHLILFLKNPTTARVKTRLAAHIGSAAARLVYTAMIDDLLDGLQGLGGAIVPFIAPEEVELPEGPEQQTALSRPIADRRWLKRFSQAALMQRGTDLGRRMAGAFEDLWQEYPDCHRAVLIGSDIPTIDTELIRSYLDMLHSVPMVLGPSADGGYYLVGFQRSRYTAKLFEGPEWSTDRVLEQTLERAGTLHLRYALGRTLNDIDTLSDLQECLQNHRSLEHLQQLQTSAAINLNRIQETKKCQNTPTMS